MPKLKPVLGDEIAKALELLLEASEAVPAGCVLKLKGALDDAEAAIDPLLLADPPVMRPIAN